MKTKKLLLTIMVFLFAAAVFLGGAPLQTSAADEIVLTMEIRTAAQLANLAALVNAGNLEKELLKNLGIPESDWAGLIARGVVIVNIKLMNDIDLSAYTNWTPIGSYQNCFTATFDGNGRKITGLNVNNTNANEAGLFGYVLFGTVKNLNVEGASIRGRHYIGGIVGWLDRSNIENCSFSGTIGGRDAVGGVAGWVTSGSELNYCSSLGGAISGNDGVGGVAGALFGKMTNCASTSTVTGMGKYVGGVVGTIETLASVSNSRATGKVTGKDYVGGIVGAIEYGSKVVSCYATGAVVGDRYVGGITGYASMRGPASVDHSVALNPSVTANISNAGRVVGLTNQNSFAGGDYTENYLENNAAISLMVVTINGVEKAVLERDFWELVNFGGIRDADWVLWGGIDGADIYPSGVTAGGTVGGRFTAANGW
ncbi:MAG: hypothetical protein FWE85_05240, partial [Clostridiales bacterium]|nr:hypothetical protein [Clostridiales bacterium]